LGLEGRSNKLIGAKEATDQTEAEVISGTLHPQSGTFPYPLLVRFRHTSGRFSRRWLENIEKWKDNFRKKE
jgi:hypothetical protein